MREHHACRGGRNDVTQVTSRAQNARGLRCFIGGGRFVSRTHPGRAARAAGPIRIRESGRARTERREVHAYIAKRNSLVVEIKDRLNDAGALLLADYRGLTVKEMQELRNQLRAAGSELKVYKNSLDRDRDSRARASEPGRVPCRPDRHRLHRRGSRRSRQGADRVRQDAQGARAQGRSRREPGRRRRRRQGHRDAAVARGAHRQAARHHAQPDRRLRPRPQRTGRGVRPHRPGGRGPEGRRLAALVLYVQDVHRGTNPAVQDRTEGELRNGCSYQ